MADITSPHDKFFKENFSQLEIMRDFLRNYLSPEVRDLLNLDQITLQKDSFIDNEYKEHFSDLLFMVPMKNSENAYIYLLFEHKSFHDSRVSLQLLRYMVRIWERDAKDAKTVSLRLIIPIVIYHGEQEWNVSTEFAALFPDCEKLQSFLPNFHYLIYDLPRYPENAIIGEYKLRMAIWIMKYIFNPDLLKEIGKAISIYMESKQDRNAEDFLKAVLLYMMTASSKVNHEDLEKELKKQLQYIGAENIMMTLAEHYRQEGIQEGWQSGKQEGIQEGLQEGLQEGWQKGQNAAIQRILHSRFGILPQDMMDKLQTIETSGELERLITIAATANSLSDFMQRL